MRTTLTIDDDVAAELKRRLKSHDISLKELVNDLLRRALWDQSAPPKKRKPFRTRTYDMGEQLINIDNTAEVLAYLESD